MFLPQEINTTSEQVKSAYMMLKFGSDEGADGITFSGNVGVRWVRTDFTALGSLSRADSRNVRVGGGLHSADESAAGSTGVESAGVLRRVPDARPHAMRCAGSPTVPPPTYNADTDYDNFLPSLNIKVNFNEGFLMRFGFSQAMARPDLGLTRNYFRVVEAEANDDGTWGGLRADTGNGYLKPITSTQFDLSAEWYFSKVGQLSLSLFHKELKDVWTNGFYTADVTNAGVTVPVEVAAPINSEEKGKDAGRRDGLPAVLRHAPGLLERLRCTG